MKSSIFSTISFSAVTLFCAALILLLLPISDNFLDVTKSFVVFFGTLLIALLFVIRSIRKQAFEISLTPYTIPVLAFGAAVLASTFFTSPYPVEGLLGMGGIYLSFVCLVLFAPGIIAKKQAPSLVAVFAGIAAVLVFLSALEFAPFSPATLLNSAFGITLPHTVLFNLTGSVLVALQLVIVAIVGLLAQVIGSKKITAPAAITLPILLLGVALFSWALLPGKPAEMVVPSFGSSWSVMLDTLHNPRAALIGVGPASYGNAYLQFKPVWVNSTVNWAVPFTQGANTPFTLITTLGFIGFAAWSWLVVRIFKRMRTAEVALQPYHWMLVASVVLQLIVPPSVVMIGIQGLLLALLIAVEKKQFPVLQIKALETHIVRTATEGFDTATKKAPPVSALIGGTLALVVIAGLGYFLGRAYAAHLFMGKAEKAANANDGVGVYQNQMTAIQLNPYLDTFHRNWASTNIIIAGALANKTDATEEEKTQQSQLVQQAISEARSATILDPGDTVNWAILAQIYSNLIGSVEQADQWATQSYVQAITMNPNDPALRVALGSVFLGQKNYQQAASIFQQATQIKADYPNSYYNLGMVLKELQQYQDAKNALETVLTLIPEGSEDHTAVKKEIEGLDALLAEQAKNAPQTDSTDGQSLDNLMGQEGGTPAPGNPSLVEQNLPPAGSQAPTEPIAPDPAALGN